MSLTDSSLIPPKRPAARGRNCSVDAAPLPSTAPTPTALPLQSRLASQRLFHSKSTLLRQYRNKSASNRNTSLQCWRQKTDTVIALFVLLLLAAISTVAHAQNVNTSTAGDNFVLDITHSDDGRVVPLDWFKLTLFETSSAIPASTVASLGIALETFGNDAMKRYYQPSPYTFESIAFEFVSIQSVVKGGGGIRVLGAFEEVGGDNNNSSWSRKTESVAKAVSLASHLRQAGTQPAVEDQGENLSLNLRRMQTVYGTELVITGQVTFTTVPAPAATDVNSAVEATISDSIPLLLQYVRDLNDPDLDLLDTITTGIIPSAMPSFAPSNTASLAPSAVPIVAPSPSPTTTPSPISVVDSGTESSSGAKGGGSFITIVSTTSIGAAFVAIASILFVRKCRKDQSESKTPQSLAGSSFGKKHYDDVNSEIGSPGNQSSHKRTSSQGSSLSNLAVARNNPSVGNDGNGKSATEILTSPRVTPRSPTSRGSGMGKADGNFSMTYGGNIDEVIGVNNRSFLVAGQSSNEGSARKRTDKLTLGSAAAASAKSASYRIDIDHALPATAPSVPSIPISPSRHSEEINMLGISSSAVDLDATTALKTQQQQQNFGTIGGIFGTTAVAGWLFNNNKDDDKKQSSSQKGAFPGKASRVGATPDSNRRRSAAELNSHGTATLDAVELPLAWSAKRMKNKSGADSTRSDSSLAVVGATAMRTPQHFDFEDEDANNSSGVDASRNASRSDSKLAIVSVNSSKISTEEFEQQYWDSEWGSSGKESVDSPVNDGVSRICGDGVAADRRKMISKYRKPPTGRNASSTKQAMLIDEEVVQDGSFPRFTMPDDNLPHRRHKSTADSSSAFRSTGDGSSGLDQSTASGMHPLDWSNKGSTYDGTSADDSTLTDADGSSLSNTDSRIVWEQQLENEGRQRKLPPHFDLISPASANTDHTDLGTPHAQQSPFSKTSEYSRESSAGTTEGSSVDGTSKQFINDLVWLEKKIADVRSRVDALDETDSYSYASEVLSPSSNDDSLSHSGSKSPIKHSIVCRDCFAPPGKLQIVIHSTKDGPSVHSVKEGSSLEGHVFPGDLIVSVDNVDTRTYSAEAVMKMMSARSAYERKITVLHFDDRK